MAKFRPFKKQSEESKETSRLSFEEYHRNRANYRKNLAGSSNDSMGQADEEPENGKLIYDDVYIIGKSEKVNLSEKKGFSKKTRQKILETEEALKTPRLLSSKEFIEHYQNVQSIIANTTQIDQEKKGSSEQKSQANLNFSNKKQLKKLSRSKNETSLELEDHNSQSKSKRNKKKNNQIETTKTNVLPSKSNRNVGSEPGERGKTVGLRIIGGSLRGTKLEYSGDHRVRPMKDRVREAVFNLIGTDIQGRHALDLFAGTGALCLEAISRGAVSGTMIEVHFPTARIAKRNIELVCERKPEIVSKINVVTTDVFFWGKNLEKSTDLNPVSFPQSFDYLPVDIPWLIFCSPPYEFYVSRQSEMLKLIQTLRNVAPNDSMFVIESDDRFSFDLLNAPILTRKRKSYPPAEVAVFIK
ncbi:MAG: RsmD family RNA methyltransferase [Planctomycetia bacterium]|nr:RsmD family RNA methyltransferase [Planctomycetia bacterium]